MNGTVSYSQYLDRIKSWFYFVINTNDKYTFLQPDSLSTNTVESCLQFFNDHGLRNLPLNGHTSDDSYPPPRVEPIGDIVSEQAKTLFLFHLYTFSTGLKLGKTANWSKVEKGLYACMPFLNETIKLLPFSLFPLANTPNSGLYGSSFQQNILTWSNLKWL